MKLYKVYDKEGNIFLKDWERNANDLRDEIEKIKKSLLQFKNEVQDWPTEEGDDRGEEIANLMLSYRHLEDARMRLGKYIQTVAGGVSIYDKKD